MLLISLMSLMSAQGESIVTLTRVAAALAKRSDDRDARLNVWAIRLV